MKNMELKKDTIIQLEEKLKKTQLLFLQYNSSKDPKIRIKIKALRKYRKTIFVELSHRTHGTK